MIDAVDQRLKSWVGRVLAETPVSLGLPRTSARDARRRALSAGVGAAPPPRTSRQPPLRVLLCYLVTTAGESPERAHQLLGELVFAALEEATFDVELAPPPVALWAALGVAPRPAFRLRVMLERERPRPAVPRVTQPLIVRVVPARALHGQVLGPGEVPIPQALVELPSLGLSVRTDTRGQFRFASVPADTPLGRLEVRAKGEVLSVRAEELPTEAGALRIRLELKEV